MRFIHTAEGNTLRTERPLHKEPHYRQATDGEKMDSLEFWASLKDDRFLVGRNKGGEGHSKGGNRLSKALEGDVREHKENGL